MGHLNSRFERTSPHGRVSGWERMSTALMKVESESEDNFESEREGSRGGCIEGKEGADRVGGTLYEDCQCMTGGWWVYPSRVLVRGRMIGSRARTTLGFHRRKDEFWSGIIGPVNGIRAHLSIRKSREVPSDQSEARIERRWLSTWEAAESSC